MKLHSRRQLRVEGLETRMLLAADVAPISDVGVATANDESSPSFILSDGALDRSGPVKVPQARSSLDAHTNRAEKTVRLTPDSDFGLAEAIAAAGRHGTVVVAAGTYSESSVMITEPVTIIGEEGAVIEFDSVVGEFPNAVDAGFHIKNTRRVQIQGLEIRDNDAGKTAILIEGSEQVSIKDNRIIDFRYGVLVESADHSKFIGNIISVAPNELPSSYGILVVNGFGNQARDNNVSGATFGIFASGENGKLLHNTTSGNYVGIILCNATPIQLPDGRVSKADLPATRWLVQGNTSTHNITVGYLVIDGSNNNTLTNNMGGGNGLYDMELTPDTYRFGLPYVLPASYDNVVNAGSHHDTTIKDCGDDNKVHGGDQEDTNVDACPVA